jgi:hypothetical protein
MAGQLGNLLATRTNVKSAFTIGLRRNRWLLPSLAAESAMLLAIVYVPFIQPIFGAKPLYPIEWLYLFSIAPAILLLEELRKYFVRTVLLPVPAIAVPAPVPIAALKGGYEASIVPQREAFVEIGPPVVVVGFSREDIATALPTAVALAEQSRSRILIASTDVLSARQLRFLSTESRVPSEFIALDLSKGAKMPRSAAKAVRAYSERIGAEFIIIPVAQAVFSRGAARREAAWIEEFSGKRVVLVSRPKKQIAPPLEIPRRLLIPVLDEFRLDVFALAGALTASSHIPDIDVVAAKVIRIPPTIPLYSTYRPESLVDSRTELSFLRTIGGLPVLRRLTPRVLLVRDIARDLLDFAESRRVDLMMFEGDWVASRHGFLHKKERKVAARATSIVVVLLPAASIGESGRTRRRESS